MSGFDDRYDYRVDLLARRNRITARLGDIELASSERTLLVDEQDHGVVVYFPRDDVRMDRLTATDHTSVCPFKGTASYWSVTDAGDAGTNVVWSYEQPWPQVARLAGYVAFYQDKVQVELGVATPAVSGRP